MLKKNHLSLSIFAFLTLFIVVGRVDKVIATTITEHIPEVVSMTRSVTIKPINNKIILSKYETIQPQIINANFNIFSKSGYSKEDLERSLSTNNHKGMIPYLDTFLEAEDKYGVNSFYLMCQLGLESGWARHKSGRNNIAGWTNGNGGYKDFTSIESCIMYVAYRLSDRYKKEVGTKLRDVCALYCPDNGYAKEVMTVMRGREKVIKGGNYK